MLNFEYFIVFEDTTYAEKNSYGHETCFCAAQRHSILFSRIYCLLQSWLTGFYISELENLLTQAWRSRPESKSRTPFNKGGLCSVLNKITGFGEEEEKSSHYGLNMLGFTRTTKAETAGCNGSIRS